MTIHDVDDAVWWRYMTSSRDPDMDRTVKMVLYNDAGRRQQLRSDNNPWLPST